MLQNDNSRGLVDEGPLFFGRGSLVAEHALGAHGAEALVDQTHGTRNSCGELLCKTFGISSRGGVVSRQGHWKTHDNLEGVVFGHEGRQFGQSLVSLQGADRNRQDSVRVGAGNAHSDCSDVNPDSHASPHYSAAS